MWGLGGRGGNKMVLSDSLMRGAKSCSARRRGGKHFFLLSPRRTRGRGGREEKNAARKKRGKVGQGFPLSLSLLSPCGDKNRLVPGADGSGKKAKEKKGKKGLLPLLMCHLPPEGIPIPNATAILRGDLHPSSRLLPPPPRFVIIYS